MELIYQPYGDLVAAGFIQGKVQLQIDGINILHVLLFIEFIKILPGLAYGFVRHQRYRRAKRAGFKHYARIHNVRKLACAQLCYHRAAVRVYANQALRLKLP